MPIPRIAAQSGLGQSHIMILHYFDASPEHAITIQDILMALYPDPSVPVDYGRNFLNSVVHMQAKLEVLGERRGQWSRLYRAAEDFVKRGVLGRQFLDGETYYYLTDEALRRMTSSVAPEMVTPFELPPAPSV